MTKLNKTDFTILAKRGTAAQITAGTPPYQTQGEFAYATDTKDLYISDGTNFVSASTNYVPYAGATGDVDLGAYDLSVTDLNAYNIYSGGYILEYGGGGKFIDMANGILSDSAVTSLSWSSRLLIASDGSTQLDWSLSGTLDFQDNTIVTTGNLGVGTASPEDLLHVNGDALFGGDIEVRCGDDTDNTILTIADDGSSNWLIANTENGDIVGDNGDIEIESLGDITLTPGSGDVTVAGDLTCTTLNYTTLNPAVIVTKSFAYFIS